MKQQGQADFLSFSFACHLSLVTWTCNITSRSYFGKMNSTLGSVVPLAMFINCIWVVSLTEDYNLRQSANSTMNSEKQIYLNKPIKPVNLPLKFHVWFFFISLNCVQKGFQCTHFFRYIFSVARYIINSTNCMTA